MIREFSPREIAIMIRLPRGAGIVAQRVSAPGRRRQRFITALGLIDKASVTRPVLPDYEAYINENAAIALTR